MGFTSRGVSSSDARRQQHVLERFLSDPTVRALLVRPFNAFPPPTPQTKAAFETRTAAINVAPNSQAAHRIDDVKDDALWLSREANIDEVSALRIVLLELQSRPFEQLLAGFSDEEVVSLQDVDGGLALGSSLFLPQSSVLSPLIRNQKADPSFASARLRRLRFLKLYLSERKYILKVGERLLKDGLSADHPSWTRQIGKTVISARDSGIGSSTKGKPFAEECFEALQSRVDGLEKGSGWFNDDDEGPDVEAEWGKSLIVEMIHILQLAFLDVDSADTITRTSTLLIYLRFMRKYAFFDKLDLPESQEHLVLPLKSMVAITSLSLLKLPLVLDQIVDSVEQRRLPPPSSELPYIADSTAIVEINAIFTEAAGSPLITASPAVFAWCLILQAVREVVLATREAKELRQSQRAVDGIPEAESSETEGGESSATESGASWRPKPWESGRRSAGSDSSLDSSIYDEVLDEIMSASLDEDPIGFLAKSAVNGSRVFEIIETLAIEFCKHFGVSSDGDNEPGLRMRLVLLDVLRASLDRVEYQPAVVTAVLAVLGGGERYWEYVSCSNSRASRSDLASVFLRDNVLLCPKLLDIAYARFPYEPLPFLRLVRALAASREHRETAAPQVMALLEPMISFTQVLPADFRQFMTTQEEENVNQVVLTSDLRLFAARESNRPLFLQDPENGSAVAVVDDTDVSDGVTIPAGTQGRVLLESNPPVVQWEYRYSALKYLSNLLQTALPNSEIVDSATGLPTDREAISEIIGAMTTLLTSSTREAAQRMLAEASDGLHRIRDIITIVFDVFEMELLQESFQPGDNVSTDLLVNCIQFIYSLIPLLPGKVWPLLARSSLLELDGRGGKLAAIIASTEIVTGHFDFLLGCIRVFGALVADAMKNAVARKAAGKAAGRFADSEDHGTGVPEKVMKKVLRSFGRTMVDVLESSPNWRFAVLDERLELETRIMSIFAEVLRYCYSIDDSPDVGRKVTGALAPVATYLVEVFIRSSDTNLPVLPILRVFNEGVRTPDTTLFFLTLRAWTGQVQAALRLCTTLVRVRYLLALTTSHLEGQLLKAAPLIARIYAAHESYRIHVVELFEAMATSAGSGDEQPPPLLGHLGAESAKAFLIALSQFDKPLDDEQLEKGIWNLLSAIVSNRQQWLAVFVLTGNTPKDSLGKKAKDSSGSTPSKPFLKTALDAMSDIQRMPPRRALAILEFIVLAEDHWPWAMSDLRQHPNFIRVVSDYVENLSGDEDVGGLRNTVETPCKIRAASFIAEILAMYIHHGRLVGDGSSLKKVLPKISYFTSKAVMSPGYNTSLHANLRRNFEQRFPGCTLSNFKHTRFQRREFGEDYFYDVELAGTMLGFDRSWKGVSDSGLAGELERANINLSVVESQVFLLQSWKFLAVELSCSLAGEASLQRSMAKVVKDCLRANAASNLPEAIFAKLVQVRGEFAFVLIQKLADVQSREPEVKALLQTTWTSIRSSGSNFELALATGDVGYYRSLLKVLFLALRAHLDPPVSGKTSSEAEAPAETLETVLAILDLIVARGFLDLAAAVHERPAESSPEDIALVTAILQTCLKVPGVEVQHDQIASRFADHGTGRVATTLFSWADRLAIDGDPVYGELAVLMLVELSSVPRLAEQLAVDGVLSQLGSARLMAAFQRGVSPLTAPRLHSIWTRGIVALALNLLSAIGPAIAPEVVAFLNVYSAQLALASSAFANGPQVRLTLPAAAEAHSLALVSRILGGFRAAGAASGVLPTAIASLAGWDGAAAREDAEYWAQSARASLRARLVPTTEAEREMLAAKPLGRVPGAENRLEERVVAELGGVVALAS
ncbi:MAG: hypothetical protein M1832_005626 [Thelocarpon impressellum]|nr:MAG: hypothetical protein M1832_005626 [Thelocarpon impressellum]